MKVRVYRKSGRPVDPADDDNYMADWRAFYDKACERAKADTLKLNRFLSYGENLLQQKHYKETYVTSMADVEKIYLQTGYPILFGFNRDEELIASVQDI